MSLVLALCIKIFATESVCGSGIVETGLGLLSDFSVMGVCTSLGFISSGSFLFSTLVFLARSARVGLGGSGGLGGLIIILNSL